MLKGRQSKNIEDIRHTNGPAKPDNPFMSARERALAEGDITSTYTAVPENPIGKAIGRNDMERRAAVDRYANKQAIAYNIGNLKKRKNSRQRRGATLDTGE